MSELYADFVDALSNFNGTDGATSYTAEAGPTMAFNGTAQLDTAEKKWGSASLYCPVLNNDYVQWGSTGDFTYLHDGTESWTADGWAYIDTETSNYRTIFCNQTAGNIGVLLYVSPFSDHLEFNMYRISGSLTLVAANNTALYDEWFYYKVTFDKDSRLTSLYQNTTLLDSDTASTNVSATNSTAMVLGRNANLGNRSIIGWIDSPRFTKLERPGLTVPTAEPDLIPLAEATIDVPGPLGGANIVARTDYGSALAAIDALPDHPKIYLESEVTTVATAGIAGGGLYPRWIAEISGTPAFRVPLSSFVVYRQSVEQQYVQCVIPNPADYADDIAAAYGVETLTIARLDLINGTEIKTPLASAVLSNSSDAEGPTNRSITIYGYGDPSSVPVSPDNITIDNASIKTTTDGKIRIRARINYMVIPGDIVTVGSDSFTADYINYIVNPTQAYCDIGDS